MLRMISARSVMPQTVGISPTALYGSITSLPLVGVPLLPEGSLPHPGSHGGSQPRRIGGPQFPAGVGPRLRRDRTGDVSESRASDEAGVNLEDAIRVERMALDAGPNA